jgi:hypothetical protein
LLNSVSQAAFFLEGHVHHVDDRSGSAWRYSLPVAPGIDFLDQLGFDPDVDIRGFPFHAGEVGRCEAARLIIPAKKLLVSANSPDPA